ncbi:hypothetical protein D3C84_819210 [compost metagenome]
MVDDEAGAGQRATDDRQEINQKRGGPRDHRRHTDSRHGLGPARGRWLKQAVVHRAVIDAHGQGEPALQLAQGQGGHLFGVVLAALAGIGEGRAR